MSKRIYICASWKHEHDVRMLTDCLRDRGYEILSFVENKHGEQAGHVAVGEDGKSVPLDEWIWSERGGASFEFDTNSATGADCVIYIGPSGTDAWAEIGAAWASGVPILALHAKGEQSGLMRRMATQWYSDHRTLLDDLDKLLKGDK